MAKKNNFKMQNSNVNKNLTSTDTRVKISGTHGGIYTKVKLIFEEDLKKKKEQKIIKSDEPWNPSAVVSKRLTPTDMRIFQAVCTLIKEKKDDNYSFSANEILLKSGLGRGERNLLKLDATMRKLSTTFICLNICDEYARREETGKDYSLIKPYFFNDTFIIRTQMIQLTTGFRTWRGEQKIRYKIDKVPILMRYNEIWNTFINVPVKLLKSNCANDVQIAIADYLIQRIGGIKKGKMQDTITMIDLQKKVEEMASEKITKAHYDRFVKRVFDFLELAKKEKEIIDYTPIKLKKKLFSIKLIVNKQSQKEKDNKKIAAIESGDLKL
ncbi:hypothetical protein [Schwartzia succinivorans]|jgi:hypothetical protein|uniref:Initiator Replication protein n=1 Tax=Schwartzia succinivorans DSM 10502 TaxID=1123243 RepID=A0A1M4W3U9_9FIRM|nr:hypothetical protein [Schwartzia succinivorans]SHE75622.1 hypothetical protein SAMN02745190_01080 [Schwartzia succinivorans DSM 10502]